MGEDIVEDQDDDRKWWRVVEIKYTGHWKRGNNGVYRDTVDSNSGRGYAGLDEDSDSRYFSMIEMEVVETWQRRRDTETNGIEGRRMTEENVTKTETETR